jgi:1-acyl-sn-glycerol-3-phosphate acyltransferase
MSLAVPLILFALALWMAFVSLTAWIAEPRFRHGSLAASFTLRIFQTYSHLMHRVRYEGREHIPRRTPEGHGGRPLLLVANHTAGIDPILIQSGLPFEARWVMAKDMRIESLDWLWDFGRIIFVDRQHGEATGIREALRHLRAGLTLGVFPEGSIERPARVILPFQPGIAMLAARSNALILPVVVDGTPQADPAWASLTRTSRARVRFLPVIDPAAQDIIADALTDHLRGVFARATGWPLQDHTLRFEDGRWWFISSDGKRTPEEDLALKG